MPVRLTDALATTRSLAELFCDTSLLRAMLDFEVALARAEAHCGVFPQQAADAIARLARVEAFNTAFLAEQAPRSATPVIPFVKAFTELVRTSDPAAAGFVHWGATSQDVADTAIVLLLKQAQPIILADLDGLDHALNRLSVEHENTVMLGRTLLQAAPPTTFGLKAAGWLGAVRRSRKRLEQSARECFVLQFGGASGALASLGSKGIAVGEALATELGLAFPDAPWHTHRDRLAALVCAFGVLAGSLGKMARDISLLMQPEIAEVAEARVEGRGGSSTLPHKHNPVGCAVALASANRVPGLVSSFLSTMPQEHERGLGTWHAEWPIIASVVESTGAAALAMAEVAEGLTVDVGHMRANIEATGGAVFAERAMMLLAEKLGRDRAKKIVAEAHAISTAQGRRLAEVLGALPETAGEFSPADLRDLEVPENYLGVARELQRRLLATESPSSTNQSKPERK